MFHSDQSAHSGLTVEEIKQIDKLNFLNALGAESCVGMLNSSVVIDEVRNLSPRIKILKFTNDFLTKHRTYKAYGGRWSAWAIKFFETIPETVKWMVIEQKDLGDFFSSNIEELKVVIPAQISIYVRRTPYLHNQEDANYYLLRYRLIEIPRPLSSEERNLYEYTYMDYDNKNEEKLRNILEHAEIKLIDRDTSIQVIRSFKNNPNIRRVKFNGIVNVAQVVEIGLNPHIEIIELGEKFFDDYNLVTIGGERFTCWREKIEIVLAAVQPTLLCIMLFHDLIGESYFPGFRQALERLANLLPAPINFYWHYRQGSMHSSQLCFSFCYRAPKIVSPKSQWLFHEGRPGGKAYLALTADGRFIADIEEPAEAEHIFADAAYQLHSQARNIKIENPSSEVDLTKGTVDSELLDQMPMLYELTDTKQEMKAEDASVTPLTVNAHTLRGELDPGTLDDENFRRAFYSHNVKVLDINSSIEEVEAISESIIWLSEKFFSDPQKNTLEHWKKLFVRIPRTVQWVVVADGKESFLRKNKKYKRIIDLGPTARDPFRYQHIKDFAYWLNRRHYKELLIALPDYLTVYWSERYSHTQQYNNIEIFGGSLECTLIRHARNLAKQQMACFGQIDVEDSGKKVIRVNEYRVRDFSYILSLISGTETVSLEFIDLRGSDKSIQITDIPFSRNKFTKTYTELIEKRTVAAYRASIMDLTEEIEESHIIKNEEPEQGAESLSTRTILEESADDDTGLKIAESDEEESEMHDQINLASEQNSEAEILEKDKQNFLAILFNEEAATKVAELNHTTDIENIQALSPELEIIHLDGMFFKYFRGGVYMNHRKRVRPLWKVHAAFIFKEIPSTVKWAYFYRNCVPVFFDEVCDALKTAIPSHVTLYCEGTLRTDSNEFTLLRMREPELVVPIMSQPSMNDSVKLDRVANEKELTSLLDMIDDETWEMADSESNEDEWRVIYRGKDRHDDASIETEDEGEMTEIEDIGGEIPIVSADVLTLPRRPTQETVPPYQIKLSEYHAQEEGIPPLLSSSGLKTKKSALWNKEVQRVVAESLPSLRAGKSLDANQIFKNARLWIARCRQQIHEAKDGSSDFPFLKKRDDVNYGNISAEKEQQMDAQSANMMFDDILCLLQTYPEFRDIKILFPSTDMREIMIGDDVGFHRERRGEQLQKARRVATCGGRIIYPDQLNQGEKERSQYTQSSATVFKTPPKKVIANQPPKAAPQTAPTNLSQAIEPPLKRAKLNEEDQLNKALQWRLQSKLQPKLQHSAFKPCREHLPSKSKRNMLGWKSK